MSHNHSRKAVVAAMIANGAISVAKFVAAVITGSAVGPMFVEVDVYVAEVV